VSLPPAHEVVERALRACAGEPAVTIVEDSDQCEVRFAQNTTTTNGRRRDRRVVMIRICPVEGGLAAGVAIGSGDVDVDELAAAASADAQSSPPSPDAAELVEGSSDPDFEAKSAQTDLSLFEPILDRLGAAFDAAASSERLLAGFVEHQMDTMYLGSSTGLRRRHAQPTAVVQLVARSTDGASSAWAATSGGDPATLDVDALDAAVATRLDWARRTFNLPAGRYEVVLPSDAVADLMIELCNAASGPDAEEGRTVFSAPGRRTRIGEQISALPFHLYSDPRAPDLECAPFLAVAASSAEASVFDNGMELGPTDWLADGRLANLRYHRAGAARSGARFAAPIDNLILELDGATGSVEDLVASVDRGLLLTCLWYIREVDPKTLLLTGLTRDGVYLIERGEVVGAVNNFRFNESPVDLLDRVIGVGASRRAFGREFGEWLSRTRMPPLRVSEFNMSSTSEAS
jgi:predicted Zn-dependent protease